MSEATDAQIDHAVQRYQQQLAQAQANLQRLKAYRDRLKLEVERRRQVYEQEQAITAYGSALAAQQAEWAMGNFYAPYYALSTLRLRAISSPPSALVTWPPTDAA